MKRTLLGAGAFLALSLVTLGTAAAESTAGRSAARPSDSGVALTQPQVTCNYRVNTGPLNMHTQPDRSSPSNGQIPVNTVLNGMSCSNSTGGNYGSCGGGNLWKHVHYNGRGGWVASKCLTRL